uniref:Interferon gamma n=1 Tax=Neogobius melanostomus TaxID=47308 RepID=A0A8C6U658_9GOBI
MDATNRVGCCVCLLLFLGQVRGSHIPDRMTRTIQNLTQHYKIPSRERFNGTPVFSKKDLVGKMEVSVFASVKKVLMGGILETYRRLINKMLEQLPTPTPTSVTPRPTGANANAVETGSSDSVREQLRYILKTVNNLAKNHYLEQEQLLKSLDSYHDIKTGDLVIQSKALWELPWLFEEASSLVKNSRRRRRRKKLLGNQCIIL